MSNPVDEWLRDYGMIGDPNCDRLRAMVEEYAARRGGLIVVPVPPHRFRRRLDLEAAM
jgi:hypothetical protein